MLRLGAIIRFLMLAVCLVPFTSAQQASAALAPYLPVTPVPAGEVPVAPVNEEDDERETEGGKERAASDARPRPPGRELSAVLPPPYAAHGTRGRHLTPVRPAPPVAADPFRNGLGTPYRC